MIKEYNIEQNNLNDIKKPQDFIRFEKRIKKGDDLPIGIVKTINNTFKVQYAGYYIGRFQDLEDAIKELEDYKQKLIKDKETKRLNTPIKRNQDGQAIIEIKSKNKLYEIIIDDDDDYYNITKYTWWISRGYVKNNKQGLLHRFIMNYTGELIIDHKNNNKLDNRKENLRIATYEQNAQNQSKRINTTSQYLGVNFESNKWKASITIEKKYKYLGTFINEIDAAKARDKYIKDNNLEFFKLNFEN
jgi:hypothetical protein